MSIAIAGCGVHVDYTELNRAPAPMKPRPAASVELFLGSAPTRPHVGVGLLEAEEESSIGPGTSALVDRLRQRAGEIGCDAMVIGGVGSKISELDSVLLDHNANRKVAQAICVVYTKGAPEPAELSTASPKVQLIPEP